MPLNIKQLSIPVLLICLLTNSFATHANNLSDGINLFESRRFNEAEKYFSSLIKQEPNNSEGLYYMGRLKFEEKEFDQAVSYFQKCAKFSSNSAEYHAWLGWAYLQQINQVGIFSKMSIAKKARKTLEKAVELDSNNVTALVHMSEYYLGAPSIAGGSIIKAEALGNKLLALNEIEGRLILLRILSKRNPKDALTEYKLLAKKIGDKPNHAGFYNRYGYFLLKQNLNNEAIIQFETLVRLTPEDANSHDSLGDGYYAAGRLQDAYKAYKNALKIDPDLSYSKKNLAKVKKALNK